MKGHVLVCASCVTSGQSVNLLSFRGVFGPVCACVKGSGRPKALRWFSIISFLFVWVREQRKINYVVPAERMHAEYGNFSSEREESAKSNAESERARLLCYILFQITWPTFLRTCWELKGNI